MKKQYLKAKVEVKAKGDVITVVASDETLDRHGEVLSIEAWDLSKFKSAPRMLVDHNHEVSSIVGKWKNPRVQGKSLLMDADFHDITELSRAVKEMVKQGYLDTVSVGFIMNEPKKDGDHTSFELIETSWVTVPANPSARVQTSLKSAMEKVVTDEEKEKIKDFEGELESEVVTPSEDEEETETDVMDDVEVDEKTVAVDMTPEGMEEMGWLVIKSKEDFDKWQTPHVGGIALSLCDTLFISKLLERSEQLETLTQESVDVLNAKRKAKIMQVAFKEAAGIISHSLRELNKNG